MNTTIEKEQALREQNYEVVQHFMSATDAQAWFDLMREKTVLEFPYAGSLNSPERLEGKPAVQKYLSQMLAQIGDLKFINVVTTPTADPSQFFNEYQADIQTPGGKPYKQVYVNKMKVEDEKVIFIREYWDTKKIVDAVNFKIVI